MQLDARSLRRSHAGALSRRRRIARKTGGFLAVPPSLRRASENRKKTRCGNHLQLAPRAPSFLLAAWQSSFTSTMTDISKLGSTHALDGAHKTVLAISVESSHLYNHLAFGRCVSANVRRAARSRVRLTDRALSLR